jgi:hypothetical protein
MVRPQSATLSVIGPDAPACADHCPFLNRCDSRCGQFFRIDKLGHAYRHCFDNYKSCPVYFDLLVERRARRAVASAALPLNHEPGNDQLRPSAIPYADVA